MSTCLRMLIEGCTLGHANATRRLLSFSPRCVRTEVYTSGSCWCLLPRAHLLCERVVEQILPETSCACTGDRQACCGCMRGHERRVLCSPGPCARSSWSRRGAGPVVDASEWSQLANCTARRGRPRQFCSVCHGAVQAVPGVCCVTILTGCRQSVVGKGFGAA